MTLRSECPRISYSGTAARAAADDRAGLGARYEVSRNTVRLAIAMLANEGAITSTPGRGTFVRSRDDHLPRQLGGVARADVQ
ncbi:GntR family transcriptional regulator [Actinopolymorpha pittospori]